MAQKYAYDITEAAKAAGIGRTALYEEIKAGRLLARKLGRRTLILAEDYERWLTSLPAMAKGGAR